MNRGEYARRARVRAGITIKKLSEMTGIAPNTIIYFEKGRSDPSINNVEILADALGLSIDDYIGHHWTGKKKRGEEHGER